MESLSKFASEADFFKAQRDRLAVALTDMMNFIEDHEIKSYTGLSDEDCAKIAQARKDAREFLEEK